MMVQADASSRPDLLRAALDYAAAGVSVHPIVPRGKVPVASCGQCRATRCRGPEHCGHDSCHGLLDATRDPARITTWWTRWPRCNVGISTGPSGLAVVDLDGPAGVQQWQELIGARPTPRTHTVRTPSGGAHLYYAAHPTRPLRSTVRELAPDIDTRGIGGYVVAPPSIRRDGVYRVVTPADVADIPTIPDWVLDAIDKPIPKPRTEPRTPSARPEITGHGRRAAYVGSAVAGEVQRVLDATAGNTTGTGRNDSLNRAAYRLGGLVGAGALDRADAIAALARAAEAIGLGEREAARTILSGLAAGIEHPREIPA